MTTSETVRGVPIPEYAGNPFIERLPPILSARALQQTFDRPPVREEHDTRRPAEERLHVALRLLHYSQPTATGRELARRVEQMIYQGYIGRNPRTSDWMRLVQTCGRREVAAKAEKTPARNVKATEVLGDLIPLCDTSTSMLVAGVPGVGKTHSVVVALSRFKQVIYHTSPFALAQIVWLRVECPPTGSLAALCTFFFAAVDKALHAAGVSSTLEKEYKRASLAASLAGMARVANLHAIGCLVIDEIQNVKKAHGEVSELLNFLVTLRNTIGIPIVMVGTTSSLRVVQRSFHDARRGDGFGSMQFDRMPPASPEDTENDVGTNAVDIPDEKTVAKVYGAEFEGFATRMWQHQYTNVFTPASPPLLNALYEETQGVADLMVKLFLLLQLHLISTPGRASEVITPELIRSVADQKFNSVRPYIRALRNNDWKALEKFEDFIDYGKWFASQIRGIVAGEQQPVQAETHGEMRLPPMIVDGSIDRKSVEAIVAGFGVGPKDIERVVAKHAVLIETGNITGLVDGLRADLVARQAQGKDRPKRGPKAPAIDGDLRALAEGAKDGDEVAKRLGLSALDSALAP
ncbi:ATP-binding protein [Sphingomonas arantia]|uniref:ATP-binding protein n=1 Tax=Sphingomonas arantia TaxID=1460676 RepID=A0ABW4U0V4_9SPHN